MMQANEVCIIRDDRSRLTGGKLEMIEVGGVAHADVFTSDNVHTARYQLPDGCLWYMLIGVEFRRCNLVRHR